MSEQQRDEYDEAIDAFMELWNDTEGVERLNLIRAAWSEPGASKMGVLFDHTGWDGQHTREDALCGCLTQIKRHDGRPGKGLDDGFLVDLMADDDIPSSPLDISPENVQAFAQWQRRVDKELGRPAPRWDEKEGWVRG